MDYFLFLLFFIIFFTLGGGGVYFWKRTGKKYFNNKFDNRVTDAVLGPWIPKGQCKAFSGSCGRGELTMEKKCVMEGTNGGKMCSDFRIVEKSQDCYVDCDRPKDVVDWGHPNDSPDIPIGGPKKGWYDFTGQGVPNDYCRWVGVLGNIFWACHTEKGPYTKADPKHITFSGGPANTLESVTPSGLLKPCPTDMVYALAQDVDLQKSIVNGFNGKCGSRCVYDHRNPKTGWTFENEKWIRIDNMSLHKCGKDNILDMKNAKNTYDKVYDVRNSWTII